MKKMKQKEFNNLNLEAGKQYKVTYRSTNPKDNRTYNCTGFYGGQSTPITDTNLFNSGNWANDFYRIYTRQIISVTAI